MEMDSSLLISLIVGTLTFFIMVNILCWWEKQIEWKQERNGGVFFGNSERTYRR